MERVRLEDEPVTRGRSPLLTSKVIRQFTELSARGLPADGVCDYLGIQSSTFWDWIQKGTRFLNGDQQPPEDAIYGAFVRAFRKACAEYRLQRLDSLHRTGNVFWSRDLAILERRDRVNFSRNDPPGGVDDEYDPDERFF